MIVSDTPKYELIEKGVVHGALDKKHYLQLKSCAIHAVDRIQLVPSSVCLEVLPNVYTRLKVGAIVGMCLVDVDSEVGSPTYRLNELSNAIYNWRISRGEASTNEKKKKIDDELIANLNRITGTSLYTSFKTKEVVND